MRSARTFSGSPPLHRQFSRDRSQGKEEAAIAHLSVFHLRLVRLARRHFLNLSSVSPLNPSDGENIPLLSIPLFRLSVPIDGEGAGIRCSPLYRGAFVRPLESPVFLSQSWPWPRSAGRQKWTEKERKGKTEPQIGIQRRIGMA